ncbi:SHOCT domain-containing protein [Halobaculum limi]|uniref:SHOCT domain-containing protein n=1 Tax=Halobaculum limi TaxID=3031916 RepID=UPI003D810FBF
MLVVSGVTAVTLAVAFGFLALGVNSFWIAFPVGFGVILPGALAVAHNYRAEDRRNVDNTRTEESPTELEVLRRRYAAGELSDEEFEQRVEHLLESEGDRPDLSRDVDIERR